MDFALFDNVFDCVAVINARAEIVYVNQAFVRFCELSQRRISREKLLANVLRFENLPIDLQSLSGIQSTTQYSECRVFLAEKGQRRVQYFLQPVGQDQWLMVFRDTTLEDRLNAKYRVELESKEQVIKTLDLNLRENRLLLRLAERLNGSEQGTNALNVCLTEIESSLGFSGSSVCLARTGQQLEFFSRIGEGHATMHPVVSESQCRTWLSRYNDPALANEPEALASLVRWDLIPKDAQSAFVWPLSLAGGAGWAIFARSEKTWSGQTESMRLFNGLANSLSIVADGCLLLEKSIRDGLTSLYNVSYFKSVFEREMKRTGRKNSPLSICLFDVDHFKKVNDNHGHQVGDQVLTHIAKLIQDTVRVSDLVARYGGEEFVVLLPDTDLEGAQFLAEKVRARVQQSPLSTEKGPLNPTISGGCASFPAMAKDTAGLIELADQGLYLAKRQGRNQIRVIFNSTQKAVG